MTNVIVNSNAALITALQSAKAGTTILLAPGTYTGVSIQNIKATGVTVTSQSASAPAVLVGFGLNNSSGLTFSNLVFSAVGVTNPYAFRVTNSSDVHFTGLNVHGSLDGNPLDDTSGFAITGSTNVSVTNSQFQQLTNGISQLNNSNLTLSGNNFHDIGYDGIDGGGTSHLLISNNTFTDFHSGTAEHPDAIQVWTTNTTASAQDITITGNTISQGTGTEMQGIFMRDPSGVLPFLNVNISNNSVTGGAWNAIAVDGANGLSIANNTVVAGTQDTNTTWIAALNTTNATVTNNNAPTYVFTSSPDIVTSGNKIAGIMNPDTVTSSVSTVLPSTSHTLILTGTAKIVGTGNNLNDTIYGNNAGDTLRSGQGNDFIIGGSGNDTINGGTGADTLTGGGGNDRFVFNLGAEHDVITDFGHTGSHDTIDISAFLNAHLTPTVQDVGANTLISFTNGATITLLGVHSSYLTATATGFTH